MSQLYMDIGGADTVDILVNKFYDYVYKNVVVGHFFHAHDVEKLRKMMKTFLNHVLGGKEYHGKSMAAAHRHIKLEDKHFDAVKAELKRAMLRVHISPENTEKILAIAETTRNDVLGKTTA